MMYAIDGLSKISQLLEKAGNLKVKHQQTCPVCGRTLVNTYRHGDTWKCRRCWESERSDT